jgi:hypothetical protein
MSLNNRGFLFCKERGRVRWREREIGVGRQAGQQAYLRLGLGETEGRDRET